MKALYFILLLAILSGSALAEDPVYFADPNLKEAVEEELGIIDPNATDMLGLTDLHALGEEIVELTGLEYAVNLTILDLSFNQISDINALSGLTNLTYLNLNYNSQISDINAVSGLTNLEVLYLRGHNQISDIDALSALTNLSELYFYDNQISNIDALSGLTNLTILVLGHNQISNINALSGLTNLTWLYLGENQISDINALSGMTNLTFLDLGENQISDIYAISTLTNLTDLRLDDNQISNIDILTGLTNLTSLRLYSNHISDINALSGITSLTSLYLYGNQISDIHSLSGLTNLTRLSLESNPLNTTAYCIYIPLIEENNPGIYLYYDPNPNRLAGDCDGNCCVDFFDFALLADYWQEFDCGNCGGVDLNDDNDVDFNDLKIIVDNWLEQVKFYEHLLDENPSWTTEGQWEFGQPMGNGGFVYGNPDPNNGYTNVNVYGVNLNGDYSTAVGGPYYLTAGPFDCRYFYNIRLSFARWLNTDEPGYVNSMVEVSNDGESWIKAWEHTGRLPITDDGWQIVEYNISSVADDQKTVYIRWGYEILEYAYPYSGWNIDDIQLWGNP